MLLRDFLTSQEPHADDLAWAGSPAPAHPALSELRVAAVDEQVSVLVGAVQTADLPAALSVVDDLAVGGRAVLLVDALPAEPVSRELAVALADRGLELLHAVELDDATSIQVLAGLSIQRAAPGAGLAAANLAAVTVDGAEPDWRRVRAVLSRALSRRVSCDEELAAARAELEAMAAQRDAVAAQRDHVKERLDTLRGSTSLQVGQAVVGLARHPVSGARGAAASLRGAWRGRHRPGPSDGSTPGDQQAAAPGRRRLRLDVPMPVPPGNGRPQPAPLRVDVPKNSMVGRSLDSNGVGGYEPTMMAWFLALCDGAHPGAVWDVGANLGLYALLARAYTDRDVVAFEPTPELADWARGVAAANDLDYRLEQLAAGESPGVATFYLSEKSDASNSLAEGFRVSKRQLDVLVEPLDRYARRTGSVPAVLKVDTETTEHYVLRGAHDVVATHRPWIFCEVLPDRAPEKELTALMSEFDYRFFHLNGADPLVETEVITGDPTLTYMNYLFAPGPIEPRLTDAARAWHQALEATPKPTRR